ncbi:MAG: hotdog fold thioesterase [Candidatus Limnocylindrales bacterium]
MFDRIAADPFARWLGVELLNVGEDTCRAALTLTAEMTNFLGVPNGGVIFALADYAFAGATNSRGEDAVALSVTIQFVSASSVGHRLIAEATATRQGRRAGHYEMTVTDEDTGALIAVCQAVSLRT